MIVSTHNLAAMFTADQLKVTGTKKAKSMEKLSSGYRINRAADDAAGLSISETMRKKIRGLKQGEQNTADGVSWVQIGDGALEEVDDMLHRMNELCIKSLNGTMSKSDREALQQEFDQIRTEIDRVSITTKFNEQDIFQQMSRYVEQGNKKWDEEKIHNVVVPKNTLIVNYTMTPNETARSATITVPEGRYTTKELIDILNDEFFEDEVAGGGMYLKHQKGGTVDLYLDGGNDIDKIGGGLSYLFDDVFYGGSNGMLLGTTVFENNSAKLGIVAGRNDEMSFDVIDSYTGAKQTVNIRFLPGNYTRQQLIDEINDQLISAGTEVRATTYGQSIKVGSEDAIITRFKGNMFKIDSDGRKYTSVFYDNTYYGDVAMTAGVYKGANIFPEDPRDEEHRTIVIGNSNNTLVFDNTNGNGRTTTVTIPDGTYTLNGMISELNSLFANPDGNSETDDALDLRVSSVNGPRYKGLKITSQIQGIGSDVGLVEDSSRSTAIGTLFKNRVINNYNINYSIYNSPISSSSAAVIAGGKTFTSTGSNPNLPFEVTSSNNSFRLSLMDENSSFVATDVTVATGIYSSASDLAAAVEIAIRDSINSNDNVKSRFGTDVADKINVTSSASRLRIEADRSTSVIRFTLDPVSGNTGYTDMFTGQSTVKETQLNIGTTVTTNTPYTSSTTIDGTNNKLVLWIGTNNNTDSSYWTTTYANRYEITLPTGNVSDNKQAILDTINNSVDKNIWLSGSNRTNGTSTYKGVTRTTGTTTIREGSTEHSEKAATMSVSMPELSGGITIDGNNNKISLSVKSAGTGTVTKNLTIPSGTYTKDQFLSVLQSTLDTAFGDGLGGLNVSYRDNKLSFTVRIDENISYSGQDSDVNVGSTGYAYNSLLYANNAGYQTLGKMENTITIEDGKNKFTLTYTDEAHLSTYQTASIYLDPGSYTRDDLITHMNTKFADAGIPIKASSSSGMLRLTTNRGGQNNRVNCNYDNSDTSAMPAIFGGKKGVVASFDSSNRLVIRTDQTYLNYLRITSENDMGSVFHKSLEHTATVGPGSTDAPKYSYLQSVALPDQITIDQWNNDLKLTYNANSKSTAISVTVADGTYTRQELADELTSKINSALHAQRETHDVNVEVRNNALRINTGEKGSSYYFTNWNLSPYRNYYTDSTDAGEGSASSFYYYSAGDFFDKVFNRATESTSSLSATDTDGTTRVTSDPQSPAIVGRKDVVSEPVDIRKNVDDTLTLDISRGNESATITIKITPGQYDSASLKNELQTKIDEVLAEGNTMIGGNVIEPGTIKVGVGGISTGVVGANDERSLNFRIDATKLHQAGTWTVDGIGGDAAFSIFYQTDEEPKPAYFKGGKDITQGVEIKDGQDKLVFDLDDVTYELEIPHGKYDADQITSVLNELLEEQDIPLTAERYTYEKVLRFTHNELGHHEISNVGGDAKSELFSHITNRKEEEKGPVWIQMSDEVGDGLNIDRPKMNATSLKLSQASVGTVRSAGHTLDMLDYALARVSDVRATFGAEQNRMEHTINNTLNAVENLTAAESRIRDADMASEMVKLSVSQILEQAGFSMLAQQNQSRQSVLNLLQ